MAESRGRPFFFFKFFEFNMVVMDFFVEKQKGTNEYMLVRAYLETFFNIY